MSEVIKLHEPKFENSSWNCSKFNNTHESSSKGILYSSSFVIKVSIFFFLISFEHFPIFNCWNLDNVLWC